MEYSELADYPMPAGRVVRWSPTARRFDWRDDPRALSVSHETHVRAALDDPAAHAGSWIGTVFRMPAALDRDAFGAAFTGWLRRHEAYRTTAVATRRSRALRRRTVPAGSVGATHREIGEVSGGAEGSRRIETLLADAVSATRWPHLAVMTVEPEAPDDREWFTVIFAADHAVMDAYTQVFAIAELIELYRAAVAGRDPNLVDCGSYADFSALERAMNDGLDALHPAVDRWRAFVVDRAGGRLPAFPLPIASLDPRVDGTADGYQASLSTWLLDADRAARFVAVATASGGSQTAGFLAAVKLAFARLGVADGIRYLMPMHTRASLEYAAAAGWFVGVVPVDDPMRGVTCFTEAVAGSAAAARENRDLVPFALPAVAALLDVPATPGFVISFVDGRAVPGAAEWTEHDRALRSRQRGDDEVYLWINRAAGGVNVSMRYPNTEVASVYVQAFVAELRSILIDVAESGDATLHRRIRARRVPAQSGVDACRPTCGTEQVRTR